MPASSASIPCRPPRNGEAVEVAAGVHWVRLPLPLALNHVNAWLIEDGDGWTVVDTGIGLEQAREVWLRVLGEDGPGRGLPVRRVLVTHFHPDHMGLAGWFAARYGAPIWATLTEWLLARLWGADSGEAAPEAADTFYRRAGVPEPLLPGLRRGGGFYRRSVAPLPASFHRIEDGDIVEVGGRRFRVMVGHGHSPEHACLYSQDLGVLIAGDQILPRISTSVAVWPEEPDATPLRRYLASLERLQSLPEGTLVLPAHDRPFTGLSGRVAELFRHHQARLAEAAAACAAAGEEGATAAQVARALFRRDLDTHQTAFAVGEALAHLHHLMGEGRVVRRLPGADGVYRYAPAVRHGAA